MKNPFHPESLRPGERRIVRPGLVEDLAAEVAANTSMEHDLLTVETLEAEGAEEGENSLTPGDDELLFEDSPAPGNLPTPEGDEEVHPEVWVSSASANGDLSTTAEQEDPEDEEDQEVEEGEEFDDDEDDELNTLPGLELSLLEFAPRYSNHRAERIEREGSSNPSTVTVELEEGETPDLTSLPEVEPEGEEQPLDTLESELEEGLDNAWEEPPLSEPTVDELELPVSGWGFQHEEPLSEGGVPRSGHAGWGVQVVGGGLPALDMTDAGTSPLLVALGEVPPEDDGAHTEYTPTDERSPRSPDNADDGDVEITGTVPPEVVSNLLEMTAETPPEVRDSLREALWPDPTRDEVEHQLEAALLAESSIEVSRPEPWTHSELTPLPPKSTPPPPVRETAALARSEVVAHAVQVAQDVLSESEAELHYAEVVLQQLGAQPGDRGRDPLDALSSLEEDELRWLDELAARVVARANSFETSSPLFLAESAGDTPPEDLPQAESLSPEEMDPSPEDPPQAESLAPAEMDPSPEDLPLASGGQIYSSSSETSDGADAEPLDFDPDVAPELLDLEPSPSAFPDEGPEPPQASEVLIPPEFEAMDGDNTLEEDDTGDFTPDFPPPLAPPIQDLDQELTADREISGDLDADGPELDLWESDPVDLPTPRAVERQLLDDEESEEDRTVHAFFDGNQFRDDGGTVVVPEVDDGLASSSNLGGGGFFLPWIDDEDERIGARSRPFLPPDADEDLESAEVSGEGVPPRSQQRSVADELAHMTLAVSDPFDDDEEPWSLTGELVPAVIMAARQQMEQAPVLTDAPSQNDAPVQPPTEVSAVEEPELALPPLPEDVFDTPLVNGAVFDVPFPLAHEGVDVAGVDEPTSESAPGERPDFESPPPEEARTSADLGGQDDAWSDIGADLANEGTGELPTHEPWDTPPPPVDPQDETTREHEVMEPWEEDKLLADWRRNRSPTSTRDEMTAEVPYDEFTDPRPPGWTRAPAAAESPVFQSETGTADPDEDSGLNPAEHPALPEVVEIPEIEGVEITASTLALMQEPDELPFGEYTPPSHPGEDRPIPRTGSGPPAEEIPEDHPSPPPEMSTPVELDEVIQIPVVEVELPPPPEPEVTPSRGIAPSRVDWSALQQALNTMERVLTASGLPIPQEVAEVAAAAEDHDPIAEALAELEGPGGVTETPSTEEDPFDRALAELEGVPPAAEGVDPLHQALAELEGHAAVTIEEPGPEAPANGGKPPPSTTTPPDENAWWLPPATEPRPGPTADPWASSWSEKNPRNSSSSWAPPLERPTPRAGGDDPIAEALRVLLKNVDEPSGEGSPRTPTRENPTPTPTPGWKFTPRTAGPGSDPWVTGGTPAPRGTPEETSPGRRADARNPWDFPSSGVSPWAPPSEVPRPRARTSDRRRSQRVVGLEGRVWFRRRGRIAQGELQDLSETGCCIRTRTPLAVGSQVPLALEFPGKARPVRSLVWVAWSEEPEPGPTSTGFMGLMFEQMDDDSRKLLQEVLSAALG